MGFKDVLVSVLFGGMVTCTGIGLIGLMVYTSITCKEVNPWLSYMPGDAGALGDMLYCMPIFAGIAFALLLVALILMIVGCAKIVTMILGIIGLCVALAAFLCEACWLGYTQPWEHGNRIYKQYSGEGWKKAYADASFTASSKYIDYAADMVTHGYIGAIGELTDVMPRLTISGVQASLSQGLGESTIDSAVFALPACVYNNLNDARELNNEVSCLGKWSSGKIKKYSDYMKDRAADALKESTEDAQEIADAGTDRSKRADVLHKHNKRDTGRQTRQYIYDYQRFGYQIATSYTSYLFHSYNIGVLSVAAGFAICYFIMGMLGVAKVGA